MASLQLTAIPADSALSSLLRKFAAADACWVSSVRPNGRAHLAPIWHVVHDYRIYIVTQSASVRATNLRENPAVSLALPDPMNVLIIEGVARPAPELRAALQAAFKRKYDWDITTDSAYDDVIEITPRKVIAWGDHGDGRWTIR